MRQELEFPQIDERKLEYVSRLIDTIAESKNYHNELLELNRITGKEHKAIEFAEYWGWTTLDMISKMALTPNPPCIKDLSKSDVLEIVRIIKQCLINCEDEKAEYFIALLERSLPLSDVLEYIMSEDSMDKITDKILEASKNAIITL